MSSPKAAIDSGMTHADLVNLIRVRLDHDARIGLHHAAVLHAVMDLSEEVPDVNSIYRALLEGGNAMAMSKLYRVLKVLEDAGLIERHWLANEGCVRRIYGLPGHPCGQPRRGGLVVSAAPRDGPGPVQGASVNRSRAATRRASRPRKG